MASSSASRVSNYDVFLSFRGAETRHSIVSHLYAALISRGLVTFKDDERLEMSDHIYEELRGAIRGSDFVVVVLSANYASSRWCLMELQLIMELHGEGNVFPVFYGVEPSAVRHQQGNFDLDIYEGPEMAAKVPMWREALKLIAGLSGVRADIYDEATVVEKIADDISRRKTLMRGIDVSNIVGRSSHMQGLKPLLDMDSENDDVRMIGIWGMGGIGKTTIAKCLFAQLSIHFKVIHFTEDMKGIHRNLNILQEKLLCCTPGRNIRPWSVEAGREDIKAKLRNRMVLLVLDGVDKIEQVHALAKETSWFGHRSRIIITTRDRGLLNSCGVKSIYEVKCLDDEDSLRMFKQIAFEGGSLPSDDFEQLSVRAARLAHGLPSAIQAYALFLRGRANSREEWEEAVCGLESGPDENTMEILKLSYEGLAKPHRNVFLHVACLFNGETYKRVISLLDGDDYMKKLYIRVLAEKSLINITTNGYIILHKLVEQMGSEIMLDNGKFLEDPEKIHGALVHGVGTEKTECISLHTCEMTFAFSMKTSNFNRIHNLKFLKVYKHVDDRESRLQVIRDHNDLDLPHTLRLLHWDAFPLTTLPILFSWYSLVELNLRHSNLETLWSRELVFDNLKRLDVTGSKNLKKLPDLSRLKILEALILEQCTRLKGIPESIGKRSTRRRLDLSYNGVPKCPMRIVIQKLSGTQSCTLEFPTAKVEMKLVNISITGNINFDFSADCEGYAEYFSFSTEQHIPVQQADPRPISEFNSLNIKRFSYKEDGRRVTFHIFPDIPGLKELNLVNLNIQRLSDEIGHFKFLEKLDFSGNDFKYLPASMSRLPRLKTLWLRNCGKLEELPELTQVQSLTLFNCRSLRSLVKLSDASQDPGRYSLLELCLDNCKNVMSLSDQLNHFTKLTYLDLTRHDFETLPSSIRDLTSLVTLCLNNCKKLKSLLNIPLGLHFLDAQGCDSLDADALEQFNERRNIKVNTLIWNKLEEIPQSLQFLDAQCSDSPEADALEHFEERRNIKVPALPQNGCFQETEMPSYKLDHQATKSRLPKFLRCLYF